MARSIRRSRPGSAGAFRGCASSSLPFRCCTVAWDHLRPDQHRVTRDRPRVRLPTGVGGRRRRLLRARRGARRDPHLGPDRRVRPSPRPQPPSLRKRDGVDGHQPVASPRTRLRDRRRVRVSERERHRDRAVAARSCRGAARPDHGAVVGRLPRRATVREPGRRRARRTVRRPARRRGPRDTGAGRGRRPAPLAGEERGARPSARCEVERTGGRPRCGRPPCSLSGSTRRSTSRRACGRPRP